MKKIKENIIKNKTEYLIIILILFALIGIFSINRYAIDTYYMEAFGMKNNAINPYFHDGRLFMSAFLLICDFLKISFRMEKFLSWILAFGSLFTSIIIMYNILNKDIKNKIFNLFLSTAVVFSPFVIEFFMFPEYSGIMCLSILFIFINLYFINKYFETNKFKYWLIGIGFGLLSIVCYQGATSLLFIIPLIFTLKDSDNFKKFIKNLAILCLEFGIVAISVALITKVLGSSRVVTNINLIDSLKNIFLGVKNLLVTTYGFFPNYVYLILSLIVFFITLYKLEKKLSLILFYILCLACILVVPALPHFFVSSPWLIPRSNIGYGVLIVFPILYYCLYAKSSNIFNYLFTGIIVITLLFMYKSSLNLVHNEIQNEVLNTIESKKIIASIDEYQQNKQKINKIVTYSDLNPTYSYPNIIAEGDINVRPLAYDWALKSTLTFNSGTSFNEGKQNKEIKDYCQKNDWDSFSLDQLKYEGDTLYVCIY